MSSHPHEAHDQMDEITDRRAFLGRAAALAAGAMLTPALARGLSGTTTATAGVTASPSGILLPPLPYAAKALEPVIDSETMELHHGKHHKAYVDALNKALAPHPDLAAKSVEAMLRDLDAIPADIRDAVRNQGGGHANHTMFWDLMTPGGPAAPPRAFGGAIAKAFGSIDAFKAKFEEAGTKRFGSGWVWLVKDKAGALAIVSTANQDSPLSAGQTPVIGNDVWEHAYYLKHRNRRADYLKAWWAVLNWDKAAARWAA